MDINLSAIPLSELAPGERGSIYAVVGPGRGVRARLAALGIRPGVTVQVVGYGPGLGPVLLEVNGTRVALGRGIARKILVVPETKK
jgi:ferrous iron transport protein A